MRIGIFDDYKWNNFFPLTKLRAIFDLRLGITKLRQKINFYFETECENFLIDDSLSDLYRDKFPGWNINDISAEEILFVNSRIKINEEILEKIKNIPENIAYFNGEELIAAKIKTEVKSYEELLEAVKDYKILNFSVPLWNYIWELIDENLKNIEIDYKNIFYDKDNQINLGVGVTGLNPYDIWIGEDVNIAPNVVLDATEGPIVIDNNAKIMANSTLVGPVYIGKNSIIKIGSKIYEGTTIGPVCKVGGEVEESIFQAYSNKQHDGFLGHSYLGEWVNLGANTTNSDLKNNYSNVKVYHESENKKINTNCQFVGAIIGDHSKTGINSTISTGTIIGIGCNLFGSEIIKNFIPDFSWGESNDLTDYLIPQFLKMVEIVKKRRSLNLLNPEKELLREIFNKTRNNERK